jgi:PAP2 superfamily protein
MQTYGLGVLPHGWKDLLRQLALFAGSYLLYQLVRALVAHDQFSPGYTPFGNATKVIDFERSVRIFAEPAIQAWTARTHWLMNAVAWSYLNTHFVITAAALLFIYVRRNDSYYFVRNMFLVAMVIGLVGYVVFPTAPPRLMPEWGFVDSVREFTHVTADRGVSSQFVNSYAAVPSIHVCFAVLIGASMARLSHHAAGRFLWGVYPLWVTFVVVATGNHYLFDAVLGVLAAVLSAVVADRLLARARPEAWGFHPLAV